MLRILHKTDLPTLVIIEKLTQYAPWSLEIFERCLQSGYSGWVIEIEEQVLAFIIVSFQLGECHIMNFCVHPLHQNKGLGRQLLEHTLEKAREQGTAMAFLEVRCSNESAIALYEKLDFIQISVRKNYYEGPQGREDALMFAKDLGVQ